MRAGSALGALRIFAIGVVSAAAAFVLHRAFISDPAPPMPSQRSASSLEISTQSDDAERPEARRPQETPAAAAAPRNEDETETVADARAPEPRIRNVPNPHVEALRHPSPIYRNVSLMAVIREAGYVCTDILSSAAGDDALAAWRVSCEAARAYLIAEDGAGGLRVEPIAYFEAPVRPPLELVPVPLDAPPRPLPAPR
jgi:hypothetical protein